MGLGFRVSRVLLWYLVSVFRISSWALTVGFSHVIW